MLLVWQDYYANINVVSYQNNSRPTVMHKKIELPSKTCACCGRPFVWRKKWRKDWPLVRYCSDRCRSMRSRPIVRSTDSK